MINISVQNITQKRMMERRRTERKRIAERMRHTERMRKTTTVKTTNVGRIPPKPVTTPPTKAHTKRTATYATKPTSNHFTKIFMPIGMDIMKAERADNLKGVIHCYSYSKEQAYNFRCLFNWHFFQIFSWFLFDIRKNLCNICNV